MVMPVWSCIHLRVSVYREEDIFHPCLSYLLKLINRVQKKMDDIVPRAEEVRGQVTAFSFASGEHDCLILITKQLQVKLTLQERIGLLGVPS